MNTIYRDILSETPREVLSDMGRYEEMYYGSATQYINRYLWKLADYMPEKANQIWKCSKNTH